MDVTPVFPVTPAPFDGKFRRIEPGSGFGWLQFGWAVFAASLRMWILAGLVVTFLLGAFALLPFGGWLACLLLAPIVGVLGWLARNACSERPLPFTRALSDIRQGIRPLLALSAVSLLGGTAIATLFRVIALPVATGAARPDLTAAAWLAAALVSAIASIPFAMALCFAPLLVLFGHMTSGEALKASFLACAANWPALGVSALLLGLATLTALLPAGLGLPILIPVATGTFYAAYRDIFFGT